MALADAALVFVDKLPASEGTVTATSMVGIVVLLLLIYIGYKHGLQGKGAAVLDQLPPGPKGLPVIGNLHQIGKLAHRSLGDMALKYGPIVSLRLGSISTVVVSSPEMAKQILKTHDLTFANRPRICAAKYTAYNYTDIAFAPYGPYWRHMRKTCVLNLFTAKRLQSFGPIRDEEISFLINDMLCDSQKGRVSVDVNSRLRSMTNNIICRMAFGKKYEGHEGRSFKQLSDELNQATGAFNLGDYFPWMEWMDVQGVQQRQKNIHRTYDSFLEKIIVEHIERRNKNDAFNRDNQDFVDVLLSSVCEDPNMEVKITRENIKAVIFDVLIAGMDTSAVTLEWAMSELLRNPEAIRKAQEELDLVVGRNRKVEEHDLVQLEYLDCIIKETMRLNPVIPLLLPRESMESCSVGGYRIPAKTRLVVNAWAIGRSPTVWKDAQEFRPQRFLDTSIDVKGQDFELIPFGSGRRGCPGIPLALIILKFALARMLQSFDWRLPDGMSFGKLDMVESPGISTPRAAHLLAHPIPRLSQHLY